MNINQRPQICGPDCRYRSLYEGTQASLTDMANHQAQALSRVGRLRTGMLTILRRNFSVEFQEAEAALGHRLNKTDDELFLAYVGAILVSSQSNDTIPAKGLDVLRSALKDAGIDVPIGTDLTSWAESIKAHKYVEKNDSPDLAELFSTTKKVETKKTPAKKEIKAIEVQQRGPLEESFTMPERPQKRSLLSLREEAVRMEKAMQEEDPNDELAMIFGDFPDEEQFFPLPPEPEADINDLPPASPFSEKEVPAVDLPFPDVETTEEEDEGLNESEASLLNLFLDPSPSPATPPAKREPAPAPAPIKSEVPLAPGVEDENPGEAKPLSKSAIRRQRRKAKELEARLEKEKAEASASEEVETEKPEVRPLTKTKVSTPSVKAAKDELPPAKSITDVMSVTKAPWAGFTPEVNVPQEPTFEPEVNLPAEAVQPVAPVEPPARPSLAGLTPRETPTPAPEVPVETPAPVEPPPLQQAAPMALRPELLMPTAKTTRARRGNNKQPRTHAAPPDAKLLDIPAEIAPPSAVLTDEQRNAIMAAICIPRPVFTSDLQGIAGSKELVKAWESECLDAPNHPVRFIGAKPRHRDRGSLVIPQGYLLDAATEFKRSAWAECMNKYRGAILYEVAVLLHKVDADVVSSHIKDHTLTLRLSTRSGMVGIVMALPAKLDKGSTARNALAAELESLLAERLTLIAVLTPHANSIAALEEAVSEEAKLRSWAPAAPVVAAQSWVYAQDGGSSSQVLMGA